jgi:thiamine biosynthesis protein ThiS
MIVKINGDPREVPDGLTVSTLLDFLEMRNDRVAIEYNLDILPRAMWSETKVQPNDRFEIVHFVGGG